MGKVGDNGAYSGSDWVFGVNLLLFNHPRGYDSTCLFTLSLHQP